MTWRVDTTREFRIWYDALSKREQVALTADIGTLERFGPVLGRPHVDTVAGSKHANMKELRTGTLRTLFAFDPHRTAILLLGGDKRNEGRFYDWIVPVADRLYDRHLDRVQRNG